jgi:molybdate transport system substrate-binding protein
MNIRLIRISFILMAALNMFTGCGASNTQSQPMAESPSPTATVEILVSAAASLQDSIKEVIAEYNKANPRIKISFNFGSSGALQQQIEQGAPVDIFISAGNKQITALLDKQLIERSSKVSLLSNSMVVIVPTDSKLALPSITELSKPDFAKIAIGDAEAVPAGSYAKEMLIFYKIWDTIQPKLIFTKDVRQVLSYVESGNVDAGFVYLTDALTSAKSKIALKGDSASHLPIEYPAGIVASTKHSKEANELLNYLKGKEATDIFKKYGFTKPAASL